MAKVLLVYLSFFLAELALAAPSASTVAPPLTNTLSTEVEEEKNSFMPENLIVELEQNFSSDFQENAEGNTETTSSTALALTYGLKDKNQWVLSSEYQEKINSPEKGAFSNLKIKHNWKYQETKINGLSYRNGLAAYMPTNKSDRQDASYQAAIGYQPRIKLSLKDKGIANETLIDISTNKNFHQFTTNSKGEYNIEYSLGLLIRNYYEFNDWFIVKLQAQYSLNRTYNKILKDKYGLAGEAIFAVSDNILVALGHENAGAVERANGSSNFNIYDKTNSEIYTYLYYKL